MVALAFLAAASIAIMYPAYERVNHVRVLQYCNGVRPAALWCAYLLFDMQFILVQALIVWGVMYSSNLSSLYYESKYILGAFILFGIATYLGTYVLSLYIKKAAFAIAAGIHVVLLVLYLISYFLINQLGDKNTKHLAYSAAQNGLGLLSPAANVLRKYKHNSIATWRKLLTVAQAPCGLQQILLVFYVDNMLTMICPIP